MYYVTRDGEEVCSKDRIKDLKHLIRDKTGIPPVMQRLLFVEHYKPDTTFERFDDFINNPFPLLPDHQFLSPELCLQIVCIRRRYRITKKRRVERWHRPLIDHIPVQCRISKKRSARCSIVLGITR